MAALNARPTDSTTVDPFHATIVDRVCADDRRREDAGKLAWTRLATDHELCQPGGPCGPFPTIVSVIVVAAGVRMRRPVAYGMVAL